MTQAGRFLGGDITLLLRFAHGRFIERPPPGPARLLAEGLIRLGWLAPVPRYPGRLCITLAGETELRHRI